MRKSIFTLALFGLYFTDAPQVLAESGVVAFTNAQIYPVSSAPIKDGTLLLKNGKISAIGKNVVIPKEAKLVDCTGKWITPGFIDSATQLGLREVSQVAGTVDSSPSRKDPIRASVRAADGVNPRSAAIGVARRHGVTSALSALSGGLISGQGVWLNLFDGRNDSWMDTISDDTGLWMRFGEGGARAVGGSRASAIQHLRETFDDARLYSQNRKNFEKNTLRHLVTSRLDLEAVLKVTSGKEPLVVSVHRASDILAMLNFAREQRLQLVILGGAEAWLVKSQLAKAKVPVILNPIENLPASFESRNMRGDNAAILSEAGVRVLISSQSTHNVSSLRFLVGNAIRAGLKWSEGLRS
ncbi:MAG: hypothetical protein VYC39_08645, partial [Myxococcota bacterium]|nr:hypothetical protein [Myxococcota bacterium]